jgi:hypothetical protein
MPDGLNSHGQVLNAAYDAYAMELGRMEMKSNYGTTHAYIPQLMDLYKEKHGLDIKETALNPQDLAGDLAAKRKALQDLSMNKDVDQQAVLQRRLDLDREARAKGVAENFNGEYDDEAGMFKNDLQTIQRVSTHLEKAIGDNENLPEWCQSKIAQAKGMIVNVMDYMISQHENGIKPKQGVAENDDWEDDEGDYVDDPQAHVATQRSAPLPDNVQQQIIRNPAMRADIIAAYKRQQGVEESQTDYQKRRQRDRDVDAGKPVTRQPKNPQTDYARKRARDRKDMELGETTNYWTRLQNERNTKIARLVGELTESVKDIK